MSDGKWKCYFEGDSKDDYKIFETIININKKSTILRLAAKIDDQLSHLAENSQPEVDGPQLKLS